MLLDILLTIFLVFLNGFFVAAEFAIVKVRASQIEIKAKSGSKVAATARHIVNHLDAYLSATQLGITLASLGLGWIGESVVTKIILSIFSVLNLSITPELAHNIALPVAFALITVLHIVFGELAPKSIAIQRPVSTTFGIALPLNFFYMLFKPFIWVLNGLANVILRRMGISPIHGHEVHSAEELQLILDQGKETGALDSSEHELIKNVFDFNERTVKKVMVPRTQIAALQAHISMDELIDTVIREGYSRMPVYKGSIDNIIGIVHAKDLLVRVRKKDKFTLSDILRQPYFIPESKKISDLLSEFQLQRVQIAIVADEFGGTAGIVTLEDIIEELVGEIQDEYDEEKPIVEHQGMNEYVVNAYATISDVNEFLPFPLPEHVEYDSIAGLMNVIFEKIPEQDEKMNFGGYEFTILKKTNMNVELVKMTRLTS